MKKNKFEGSKKDMAEDRAMAKKAKMPLDKWERSAADVKHDTKKKMAGGGKANMEGIRAGRGAATPGGIDMSLDKGRPMDVIRAGRGAAAPGGTDMSLDKGRPANIRPSAPVGGGYNSGANMAPSNPIARPTTSAPAVMPPPAGGQMYRAMKGGGCVKKMAKGGMVKGAGCAVRGVKKAKSY